MLTGACLLTLASARAVEIDSSFKADFPYGTIHSIAVEPDGSIVAAGEFNVLNGQSAHSVVKLTSAGTLSPSFTPPDLDGVFSAAIAPDGTIDAGGSSGLASVQADGTVRMLLSAAAVNGRINAVALSGDKLVLGGNFWSQPDVFVARLNPDGTPDSSFKSGLKLNFSMEAGVNALALQADGKLIVGGNFDTDAGFTTLARLNADGSVDARFSHANGAMLYPKSIVVLADGKILVGGTRDSSGNGFIRRLNSDGSIDATFTEPDLDGAVETVATNANGDLILGGSFTHVNGGAQQRLARLDLDGHANADWSIGANNIVKSLAFDGSGNLLVGGAFSQIGGVAQNGLARVLHFDDGQLQASSNTLHLTLRTDTEGIYAIESSTDLATWTDTGRRNTSANGLNVTLDSGANGRLFLRARLVK
jgi:uncharacterized delta-60 repeat protein